MERKRLALKVGFFVFIGLVVLAVLMLQFSKGMSFFRPTYKILLHAPNVGGLKMRAAVLMAGVQVGTVSDVRLKPDGKSVTIDLTIYQQYVIYKDAEFRIQQSGFLGDQYVAIKPTKNQGGPFRDLDNAETEEPFDLQEVARSAAGFIRRIDDTAKRLNATIDDVRRVALNDETLSNLSFTVSSMRQAAERAVTAMDEINILFATNGPAIAESTSNIVVFSKDMTRFAEMLNTILATNGEDISVAVKNIQSSSESLKDILQDVEAGKGTAGTLLHNERVAADVAAIANNLSVASSNLNRLGLWRFLWHHEVPPRSNAPSATASSSSPPATRRY